MAEKIVSPGVFTRERDLSFLPAGVAQIGAAIIGPTVKGPAFEPVIIESFKEFEATFGPKTLDSYVPYTVEAYLKSAGRVTVVRTLGLEGYTPKLIGLNTKASDTGDLTTAGGTGKTWAVLHPTQVDSDATFNVSMNDEIGEIVNMYLTGSAADASGSFSGSYFVLQTPDPAAPSTTLKYGFFFSGSFVGGNIAGTAAGGEGVFQPGGHVGSAFSGVTYKKPITLPKNQEGSGTNFTTGGLSASFATTIRDAINTITSSAYPGMMIFSASLFTSGTAAVLNSGNTNAIRIRNIINGNVYSSGVVNGFNNTADSSRPGMGATASFQVDVNSDLSGSYGTPSDGLTDGKAFTLLLKGDNYSATTNFSTGHTDSGNIYTAATAYSGSIDTTNEQWLGKVFGITPKDRYKPVYNYLLFKNYASRSFAADPYLSINTSNVSDAGMAVAYAQKDAYEARTPWIVSQNLGSYASPKTTRLFKFHTRSHGSSTNYQYKVAISNIKDAASVAGSDYGSFSVQIRRVDTDGTIHSANNPYAKSGDKDLRPHIVEQFNNLTLDPDSPNFIARVIGDRYQKIDENGKVTVFGDYPNLSRHIWVEVPEEVKDKGVSPDMVPFGFEALLEPIHSNHGNLPTASFIGHTNTATEKNNKSHKVKKTQVADNVYNKNIHYGFDYLDTDNYNYLLPLSNNSSVGDNKHFNLSDCNQHPSASLNGTGNDETVITPDGTTINLSTKKFIVPFQGGFDGLNPARYIARDTNITAANMLGFDLSTAEKAGTKAYKRAINAVSNPDEYDINLLVTPGPNHRLHSAVTTHAKNTCENRGDALYIMDASGYSDTISQVTNTVEAFDSNYAATYYP